jgi:hypothetical protein
MHAGHQFAAHDSSVHCIERRIALPDAYTTLNNSGGFNFDFFGHLRTFFACAAF